MYCDLHPGCKGGTLSSWRASSRSSLKRDAERAVQTNSELRWSHRINSAISQSEMSVRATIAPLAILVATLILSVVLRATRPTALNELAPKDTGAAFNTLWQVHAAVVALSIPLLILLVEQARASSLISTSVGQVLVSRTRVIFVTIISLGSVVVIGFSALYLSSDAVLLLDFGLSSFCILFILWGYSRALDLLLSTSRLRSLSQALLESRLAASMTNAFELRWMDEKLASHLDEWHPVPLLTAALDDGHWSVVRSTGKGRLIDVAHAELMVLMKQSVPSSALLASRTQPSDQTDPEAEPTRLYLRSFGERVLPGDPLLAINVPVGAPILDSLAALFTVEPADD